MKLSWEDESCSHAYVSTDTGLQDFGPYRSGAQGIKGVTEVLNFDDTNKSAKFVVLLLQRKGCLVGKIR